MGDSNFKELGGANQEEMIQKATAAANAEPASAEEKAFLDIVRASERADSYKLMDQWAQQQIQGDPTPPMTGPTEFGVAARVFEERNKLEDEAEKATRNAFNELQRAYQARQEMGNKNILNAGKIGKQDEALAQLQQAHENTLKEFRQAAVNTGIAESQAAHMQDRLARYDKKTRETVVTDEGQEHLDQALREAAAIHRLAIRFAAERMLPGHIRSFEEIAQDNNNKELSFEQKRDKLEADIDLLERREIIEEAIRRGVAELPTTTDDFTRAEQTYHEMMSSIRENVMKGDYIAATAMLYQLFPQGYDRSMLPSIATPQDLERMAIAQQRKTKILDRDTVEFDRNTKPLETEPNFPYIV